ncbi:MAG: B12-binding domain-containing radical SAM protein [Candidatus Hermodarchaeota archaeon]
MLQENVIRKDWRDIDLSFGLVYPNTYKIGMSSYAIRLLYFLINSFEKCVCERFFIPNDVKYPAIKDNSSLDTIRSIENKILPKEFDVLGFSLQFENDFKNVLWFLEKAEIPPLSSQRNNLNATKKHKFPLIVGGGTVATSNPQPFSKFFDLFFIGDSEPQLELMLQSFVKYKFGEMTHGQLLTSSKSIEGIYIPQLNNQVERSILINLDNSPIPDYQLLSKTRIEKPIFENVFFVEVNRGCPFQCKFCLSSFHNHPFRNRSLKIIKKAIENGIQHSIFETINLIGPCVSAHPEFLDICKFIINKGKKLKLPSIRIEHLTKDLIKILEIGNIKSITLAPETGSEKLRYDLGKRISDPIIFSTLEMLKRSEVSNVKLYFLIGLPYETMDHINETIEFIKIINEMGFEKDSIKVNINPFVPKLNTPYGKEIDFYLVENFKSLSNRFKKIESEIRHLSSIKLKFRNPQKILNNARLQTIISLGDKNISDLMYRYYSQGANFGSLRKAQKEVKFSLDDYLIKIKSCYTPWKFKESNKKIVDN